MGQAVPRRRRGWFARPLVATSFIAEPNPAGHVRRRRDVAPAAPHRQADCCRGRGVTGHRQPYPSPLGIKPDTRSGARRAGAPVRARAPRRAHPYRHQEARQVRKTRPPHHTRSPERRSRGAGHEFVHVAIDDASRLAFSQIRRDQKKESAIAFLKEAVTYYRSLGMKVTGIMTDNGSCYRAKAFARACRKLGLKHIFTRPYRPQTNGKAERFIQTVLREWAYARAYDTSDQRAKNLPIWLHHYNWHRPHGSLQAKPPISRLGLPKDDLLRFHS
ncbi:bll8290 [Bradyrhizobium diazoefficiens USDA 110]|uniref:Bll8290 protein n=1 Tax=Bradyrhizobium diazoefficiens (strain JCM 10833 / BCRC 13528 / IAM 13628 / NBRC 14792 / USDA 110) TaxID=224911 RepID=Q89B75_BRADU|nr:bll8290 [Bradyrhizobium diazoefficiens USDA 110]